MKHQYSVHIVWSQEDGAYVANAAELPGCMADGQSPEEALAELKVVIDEWLATAKEERREIPEPLTAEELHKGQHQFQKKVQAYIKQGVEVGLQTVLQQFAQAAVQQREQRLARFPMGIECLEGASHHR
jgi:predicted RNase H-like HicB family nuclease